MTRATASLLLLSTLALAGCSQAGGTHSPGTPRPSLTPDPSRLTLVSCAGGTPSPPVEMPATAAGLNLEVRRGSRVHSLAVPPGSVPSGTRVRLGNRAGDVIGIEGSTNGAPLARLALLTLSYADCPVDPSRGVYIVKVDGTGKVIGLPFGPSYLNAADQSVTAPIATFSQYALATDG